MAGHAGSGPFYHFDDFTGEEYCFDFDPFDGDDSDGCEEYCVSAFSFPDGEEPRAFGFAFPDGDDNFVVEDHASQASREDPILETLGRSFDSDEGLGEFLPQLVSAFSSTMDLAEDTSEEEAAGDGGDAEEFIRSGLDREAELVIQEAAVENGDPLFEFRTGGLILEGLDREPGLVIEEAAVDDGDRLFRFRTGGGFDFDTWRAEVSNYEFRLPAFRMLVEDIDADEVDLHAWAAEQFEARVQEVEAQLRQSHTAVAPLPEVVPTEEEASSCCPVCKDGIGEGQLIVRLPCRHFFHGDCIGPWLAIRNTCPVCRCELPRGYPEHDHQLPTAGGAPPVQHGATAQNGGASGRATVGSENATECTTGETRLD